MQLHEAIVEEQEHLRRSSSRESGSPIGLTYAVQLQQPVDESKYWAEMAGDFEYEYEVEPHEFMGAQSRRIMRYEATGLVAAITPWNSVPPERRQVIPALAAGNTVVVEAGPRHAMDPALGRLVAEETDIPAGSSTCSQRDPSRGALTTDPRVDMVTFTGSTAVGRRIMAAAAHVKKVFLELGGKSALHRARRRRFRLQWSP